MPLVNAVGVFACALSPALVLGALVVYPHPYLVILALSGAFGFVVAFMLCGLVWTLLSPLRGSVVALMLCSTVIMELGRWGMYWCHDQVQDKVASLSGVASHRVADGSPPLALFAEQFAWATAIGTGIAATHGLLMTGRLYGDAMQVGSVYLDHCAMSRHGLAALTSLAFVTLQVLWTVYGFTHAYPSGSKRSISLIFTSHAAASSITFLHADGAPPSMQCGGVSLALLYSLVFGFGALAARTAMRELSRLGDSSLAK